MRCLTPAGVFLICLSLQHAARATSSSFIFESATLGQTQDTTGYIADFLQYVGARFQINSPTLVDHVGGNISGQDVAGSPTLLFAAIAPISGPSGFPLASPGDFQPIASTAFPAAFRSNDLSIPLNVLLTPGSYALIFGGGRFGATGKGVITNHNFDTPQASYFFGQYPSPTTSFWLNSPANNLRFTVTGTFVPEPAAVTLFVIGLFAIARRRGTLTA